MRVGIALAVVGGAALVVELLMRGDREGDPPVAPAEPSPSGFPVPIAVGRTDDPDVAPLLEEMGTLFEREGIDLGVITPAEVTMMPSVGQVAIPPRSYWPRMALTLREVFMPLRKAMGVPLVIRGGYRAPDYNAAVGGEPKSRHQAFEALDIRVASGHSSADRRKELAQQAAKIYRSRGSELKMGFGVYGFPVPGNIHVDTGWKRRTWNDAKRFLA